MRRISPIKHIKKTTIRGQTWEVHWKKRLGPTGTDNGLCWLDDHVIEVKKNQDRDELLDTLVHEVLHAEFPEWSEGEVAGVSRDISGVLLKVGARIR